MDHRNFTYSLLGIETYQKMVRTHQEEHRNFTYSLLGIETKFLVAQTIAAIPGGSQFHLLPIRDWNLFSYFTKAIIISNRNFTYSLLGIETTLIPGIPTEQLSQFHLLPIRDWNEAASAKTRIWCASQFHLLPIRDWNFNPRNVE